jgi:hypothetical protein
MAGLMIMPACQNPRAVSISHREADDVDTFNFSEVKEVRSDWYINGVLGSISLICSLCFFVYITLLEKEADEDNKMDRRIIENSVRPDGIQLYNASYLLPLHEHDKAMRYFLLFGKFCVCVSMYICSYMLANPI